MVTEQLQKCIDACAECAAESTKCADLCVQLGLAAGERLCRQCADHCQLCITAMRTGSTAECGPCSEMCDRCAIFCDYHQEDEQFRLCAQVCYSCADECRRSAGI